jgi:hypothetical protein
MNHVSLMFLIWLAAMIFMPPVGLMMALGAAIGAVIQYLLERPKQKRLDAAALVKMNTNWDDLEMRARNYTPKGTES